MNILIMYVGSMLVWSILLNYYQHMQNRRRRPMKNETLVITISLALAPMTLVLVIGVALSRVLGKLFSNKTKVKVDDFIVGDKP